VQQRRRRKRSEEAGKGAELEGLGFRQEDEEGGQRRRRKATKREKGEIFEVEKKGNGMEGEDLVLGWGI
jgi:hypothetical protein